METFPVAHLNIQNVNVIVIFVSPHFDTMPADQQQVVHHRLQAAACNARLAGNVVPVWQDRLARTKFIAPPRQHPFFRSVSYEQLYLNVNRTLACD